MRLLASWIIVAEWLVLSSGFVTHTPQVALGEVSSNHNITGEADVGVLAWELEDLPPFTFGCNSKAKRLFLASLPPPN